MTEIFRKRPILGNRILVPLRDESDNESSFFGNEIEEADYRLISVWESEKRCNYVKHLNSDSLTENEFGCESIEIPIYAKKHSMWKCLCPPNHRLNRLKQRFNLD
jgi:hypothetical protein